MSAVNQDRSQFTELDTQVVQQTVADAINRQVGRGFDQTHPDIFARTINVLARTLKGWRLAERNPELTAFLKISNALGPDFVNSVLALIGMGRAERLTPTELKAPEVLTAMMEEGMRLSKCLEDGHLDHMEKAEMKPRLLALANKLTDQANAMGNTEAMRLVPRNVPHKGEIK